MPFDGGGFGNSERLRELELLLRARRAIDTPQKWCKHRVQARGRLCMAGALMRGAGMTRAKMRWEEPTIMARCVPTMARRGYRILSQYVPERFDGSVEAFNDNSHTRHSDVLEVFDHAITEWTARAGI